MTEATILEQLRQLFSDFFGPSTLLEVGNDGPLWGERGQGWWTEAGLDSLDRVEFILAVEEAFHVEISDDIADASTTLTKLAWNIDALLVAQKLERAGR